MIAITITNTDIGALQPQRLPSFDNNNTHLKSNYKVKKGHFYKISIEKCNELLQVVFQKLLCCAKKQERREKKDIFIEAATH